jgi:hypothetical protein
MNYREKTPQASDGYVMDCAVYRILVPEFIKTLKTMQDRGIARPLVFGGNVVPVSMMAEAFEPGWPNRFGVFIHGGSLINDIMYKNCPNVPLFYAMLRYFKSIIDEVLAMHKKRMAAHALIELSSRHA